MGLRGDSGDSTTSCPYVRSYVRFASCFAIGGVGTFNLWIAGSAADMLCASSFYQYPVRIPRGSIS